MTNPVSNERIFVVLNKEHPISASGWEELKFLFSELSEKLDVKLLVNGILWSDQMPESGWGLSAFCSSDIQSLAWGLTDGHGNVTRVGRDSCAVVINLPKTMVIFRISYSTGEFIIRNIYRSCKYSMGASIVGYIKLRRYEHNADIFTSQELKI